MADYLVKKQADLTIHSRAAWSNLNLAAVKAAYLDKWWAAHWEMIRVDKKVDLTVVRKAVMMA